MTATIPILPGDGLGPEGTKAAIGVGQAVANRFGHTFDLPIYKIGGAALDAGESP